MTAANLARSDCGKVSLSPELSTYPVDNTVDE